MNKRVVLAFLLCGIAFSSFAQKGDDLMSMLDSSGTKTKKELVTATFKATRLINNNTVQNLAAGVLDFRILHRFGSLDQGAENFFGLDNATTRIGLDYGITNWLMVGIAHNTYNKEDDGFLKVRLLQQRKHGTPITLSYVGAMSVQTTKAPVLPAGDTWKFSNRLYYANQLLIASKLTNSLSVQLMPTLVHYNLVDSNKYDNNTIAIGVGGRLKVSRRVAITAEYFYRVTNADMTVSGQTTYNSLSVGVDIETGGHVFQLMITNSQGLTERTFIGQTTDNWGHGSLHFGFNISRVFTIVKPKEFRNQGNDWDK